MPLPFLQLALYSVSSAIVGGIVALRVLGKGRRGYSRKLAQELSDSVHERCSAYRGLENRIDAVIADFDRREAELRNEIAAGMAPASADASAIEPTELEPAAAAPVAPEPTSAELDALSWMDACDGPADATSPAPPTDRAGATIGDAGATAFVGLPQPEESVAPEERVAMESANVVDQITRSLEVVQRQKSQELAEHRGRIEGLEGRIRTLESTIQALLRRESAPAAKVPASEAPAWWAQGLAELHERIARSDRELAAWHAQHAEWARERRASLESVRELATRLAETRLKNPEAEAAATSLRARAEDLAREAANLQATIARREIGTERVAPTPARTPVVEAAQAAPASKSAGVRIVPGTAEPTPPQVAEQPAPESAKETSPSASAVDATPGPLPSTVDAGAAGSSQISQLMRNLEIAQGEAEKYKKKLQEQGTQFTAAYAMLDRIRPYVQALEKDYAAHGPSRPS